MNLQTYRANTMAEVLAKVKKKIGPDAVILHTRTVKTGGVLGVGGKTQVEITATADSEALRIRAGNRKKRRSSSGRVTQERKRLRPGSNTTSADTGERKGITNPAVLQAYQQSAVPPRERPEATNDLTEMRHELQAVRALVENFFSEARRAQLRPMPETLQGLYRELIAGEVADELAHDLIRDIQQGMTGVEEVDAAIARDKLLHAVESRLPTTESIRIEYDQGPRIIALIGPTGVGKTTTIAKLAANLRLREHRKVGLLTIDTYRIAAVDQLRTYAKIIDVPLLVALTPDEIVPAIERLSDRDVILIDTAGRSPHDDLKLDELKQYLDQAKPHEVHLVLSCTSHSGVLMKTVEQFSSIGVDHLIFTKLDEAVGFGVILNVLQNVDRRLSFVTTGQDVPNDIEPGDSRRLAEAILAGRLPNP